MTSFAQTRDGTIAIDAGAEALTLTLCHETDRPDPAVAIIDCDEAVTLAILLLTEVQRIKRRQEHQP